MKRAFLFLSTVLIMSAGMLQANPVDLSTAKGIAQKFTETRFATHNAALELVYSASNERGESCFYAFSVGENGFVIVSADDCYRPIVGYSTEGTFETENMSPELSYYLDNIVKGRCQQQLRKQSAAVAAEWDLLLNSGKLISRNNGKAATHLIQTLWNQNEPYNLFCPDDHGGPGGRAYAGCVATAMSQVMKYWDHPLHGTGSHTYTPLGGWGSYPSYPPQTANFGETTYQWDKMPIRISVGSPEEEINAIALLMYHCGVAVNMMYGPSGSGAYSYDVPQAITNHFSYSEHAVHRARYDYSLSEWQNMLKETFDLGWPVYYSGHSERSGHAFVCDGYDDNDLFHFNWGWGGSGDGWFVIDEIDFSGDAAAIFNFVPKNVYNYTSLAPTDFKVTPNLDNEFSATISWTNPTMTTNNTSIPSIEKMVLMRDGVVIHETEPTTPGASMSFVDRDGIPTSVSYCVYAVCQGVKGNKAFANDINLGPTCTWTVSTTSNTGWQGGKLVFSNSAGSVIDEVTSVEAGTHSQHVEMPQGRVAFTWNAPETATDIAFSILDGNNDTVFSFNGNSSDMPTGVFYEANNACGNTDTCDAPYATNVTIDGNDAVVSWTSATTGEYGFNIYRDGILYDMVHNVSTFTDAGAASENHCYFVTAFCANGESYPSNECCTPTTNACEAPHNLYFEILETGRVKLHWERPAQENLTGYMIYRKTSGENYKRIKLVNASQTEMTDSHVLSDGTRYQYQVTAYYKDSDCESAPAIARDNQNLNYVRVNKTIIPGYLTVEKDENGIFILEWDAAFAATSYNVYRNGERIATGRAKCTYSDESPTNGWCCYAVTGVIGSVESSPSNTVCISTTSIAENRLPVAIYPNPSTETVHVVAEGHKEITVFNVFGQEVLHIHSSNHDVMLNLSHLTDGTYLIKTVTESGSSMDKVIIRN